MDKHEHLHSSIPIAINPDRITPSCMKVAQFSLVAATVFFQALAGHAADLTTFSGTLKQVTITDAQETNKAPAASFTYSNTGATFTFDAGGSSDPDGSITEYKWDFGNGTTGSGATASVDFAAGSYPVTLTVIDNNNGVAIFQQNVTYSEGIVLEDAEDGTTDGWSVYDNDPAGATISNEYNEIRQSKVVVMKGSYLNNGFQFSKSDNSSLGITDNFKIRLSFMTTSNYRIFFELSTTAGTRYLAYSDSDTSTLGSSSYIYYGLGGSTIDGTWKTITRDLNADIIAAQPNVKILKLDKILFRGNISVDDIKVIDF